MTVKKIVGIYHANGGIIGELKYMTGKITGTSHCALCDITNTTTGRKDNWKKCEEDLGLPVDLVHLNEREKTLKEFTEGHTPCVVGETDNGYIMLLDNNELEKCKGKVEIFEKLLKDKLND